MRVPWPISVDATRVYWATGSQSGTVNDGTLATCAIAGCAMSPTVLASGLGDPDTTAADATGLYWGNWFGDTVMKCPLAGCGAGPTLLASGQAAPISVALDATDVYWLDEGTQPNYTDGALMKAPK